MNCASCKYWEKEHVDAPKNIEIGACQKVQMFWYSTEWKEVDGYYARVLTDESTKAFVQDGSDYYAELLTLPDFGCVQFEEKTPCKA